MAEENAGKQARCPACGSVYTIPFPNATPREPAADPLTPLPIEPSSPESEQFWMRTAEGVQYGPVDRATLDRWFAEGRIGPGYLLRQSEVENWQAAETFRPNRPTPNAGANPFAYTPGQAPVAAGGMYHYPKPDQSGIVLALGIIGILGCLPVGIAAWVKGHSVLKDMASGQADPQNKAMVQVGYALGIVSVVLSVLCLSGYFLIFVIALIGQAM